jgi:hypothetical protein
MLNPISHIFKFAFKCLAVNVFLYSVKLRPGNYVILYVIGVLANKRNSVKMQSIQGYDNLRVNNLINVNV